MNPKIYSAGWDIYFKELVFSGEGKKGYLSKLYAIPMMDIYHLWRKSLTPDVQKIFKNSFHQHYLLYYKWSIDAEGNELPFKDLLPYKKSGTMPKWFMKRLDIEDHIKEAVALIYAEFYGYIKTIIDYDFMKSRFMVTPKPKVRTISYFSCSLKKDKK